MRKLSQKRIDKALEAFKETLPSFCESALFNGKRVGNEWCVSDLENNESKDGSGSCFVNMETGEFFDHATKEQGGSIKLFGTIFGLTKFTDVIRGMEAWCEDGTLPDGTKGRPTRGRLEISKDEVIDVGPKSVGSKSSQN